MGDDSALLYNIGLVHPLDFVLPRVGLVSDSTGQLLVEPVCTHYSFLVRFHCFNNMIL